MTRRLAVLLILLLLGSSSWAQARAPKVREGVWNDSLDQALNTARYSGRPVLIFFAEDWCGYCEQMEKVLALPEVRAATRRFVLVKTRIETYPEAAEKYGVDMHHQVVMLDWSWHVLGKITEYKSARDFALKVMTAAATNDLTAGRKLMELGYYRQAAQRFDLVKKLKHPKDLCAEAAKLRREVDKLCERDLSLARQLALDGRADEAVAALERIIEQAPDDAENKARALRARILAGTAIEPKPGDVVEEKLDARAAAKEAQRLLESGMVAEWDRRFLDAVDTYQKVVKQYPDAPAAVEAKKRRELLLGDPATRKQIVAQKSDRDCTRWLEMGKLYERSGRTDLAIRYFNTILTQYPDHPLAREAREHLDEIARQHPQK